MESSIDILLIIFDVLRLRETSMGIYNAHFLLAQL